MITKNRAGGPNVTNGTRGVFTGVDYDDQGNDEYLLIRSIDTSQMIAAPRVSQSIKLPRSNKTIRRKQFPVVPAFAATIHKSQGLTLNTVPIYLADINEKSAFCLIYVALTKCANLTDIFVLGKVPEQLILSLKPPDGIVREWKRLENKTNATQRIVGSILRDIEKHNNYSSVIIVAAKLARLSNFNKPQC